MHRRRPLLITGSHRSGSTWVGQVLAASRDLAYVHEPFNVEYPSGWVKDRPSTWFLAITQRNQHEYEQFVAELDRVVDLRARYWSALRNFTSVELAKVNARSLWNSATGRVVKQRALIKDPIALFSAPWIEERYDADIVVTVRHPGAFAVSLAERSWTFDFRHLERQEALMAGTLAPFADEVAEAASHPPDIRIQAALLWKCIYNFVREELVLKRHSLIVRHEDLIASPREQFRTIMKHCCVSESTRVRVAVEQAESRRNSAASSHFATRWHAALDAGQERSIRDMLGTSADWIYPEESWART